METKKMNLRILNYLKKKRLLIYKEEADSYQIDFTEYGEPVIMSILESNERHFLIQLLYTDTVKLYRATLSARFLDGNMIIDDVKVLQQPSYSPRFKEPFRKGYGSLLMKWALLEAEKRSVKTVTGDMVSFNEKQKKRQADYYSKFGFTIDSKNKLFKEL